jgi:hypothetical protein
MSARRLPLAPLLLAALAACSDSTSPEPTPTEDRLGGAAAVGAGAERLVLMTQNLFVGADVDAVLLALSSPDPSDDFPTLLATIQTLERTDFPSRAAALADRIASTRPHAVGLQEVSAIQVVLPPFGVNVQLAFLPILLQALEDRGLDYDLAAQVQNIDANPAPGIRLIDYDALLVDAEQVTVHSSSAQNFNTNLGDFGGINIIRGWVSADITVGGNRYTLVSTHPEPDLDPFDFEGLRAVQIGEIVAGLGSTSPAVVMGDLNDVPGSPMYEVLTGAGFTDVWAALRPGAAGFTCCHEPDLSDRVPEFDERIDYLFLRGFDHVAKPLLGQITRFGMEPSDRVDGPLGNIWVSDHAGLIVRLLLPPGPPAS